MNRALVYGIVCGGLSAALMLLLARTPFGIVFAYVKKKKKEKKEKE